MKLMYLPLELENSRESLKKTEKSSVSSDPKGQGKLLSELSKLTAQVSQLTSVRSP